MGKSLTVLIAEAHILPGPSQTAGSTVGTFDFGTVTKISIGWLAELQVYGDASLT